jgi:single-strand DNA-binding protein
MYPYIQIAGHLGRDIEKRFSKNGKEMITFPVGVDSFGSSEKKTEWFKVIIWDEKLFKIASYLKKGSTVFVHGVLMSPSAWIDKNSGEAKASCCIKATTLSFLPGQKKEEKKEESPSLFGTPNDKEFKEAFR